MTLVVETNKYFNPASNEARRLLPNADSQLSLDDRTFRYYSIHNVDDQDRLIISVIKLPGVLSAYFKPDGSPPR